MSLNYVDYSENYEKKKDLILSELKRLIKSKEIVFPSNDSIEFCYERKTRFIVSAQKDVDWDELNNYLLSLNNPSKINVAKLERENFRFDFAYMDPQTNLERFGNDTLGQGKTKAVTFNKYELQMQKYGIIKLLQMRWFTIHEGANFFSNDNLFKSNDVKKVSGTNTADKYFN